MKRGKCLDCDGGLFEGDGKCGMCHGSGKNVHLNSDQVDCEKCRGSGICQTCGGTGLYVPPSDFIDLFSR
jgi:DnaJ-class molecular chaperone